MVFRWLSVSVWAAFAAIQPAARVRPPDLDLRQLASETRHLTVSTSSSPAAAAPGARVLLLVDVAPKPKMHVYAPDQQDYIPITLTITPDTSVRTHPPRYPAAEKFFFAPLNETYRVYSKPFRVTQPITLSGQTSRETLTISGNVRYQACDDAVCYVPQDVPVTWTLRVKPVNR